MRFFEDEIFRKVTVFRKSKPKQRLEVHTRHQAMFLAFDSLLLFWGDVSVTSQEMTKFKAADHRDFVAFPVRGGVSWGRDWTRVPQECGQGLLKQQNRMSFARFSLSWRVSSKMCASFSGLFCVRRRQLMPNSDSEASRMCLGTLGAPESDENCPF